MTIGFCMHIFKKRSFNFLSAKRMNEHNIKCGKEMHSKS